jgi:hypothetical protein
MTTFSTCSRCGCKAVVVVLTGGLVHAAVHHQDLCLKDEPNRQALYCTKYVAEPVHTHDEPSNQRPAVWTTIVVAGSSSSTSSSWVYGDVFKPGPIRWLK